MNRATNAPFDPTKPTIIITHGWQPPSNALPGFEARQPPQIFNELSSAALQHNANVNIIEFSWSGAYTLNLNESGRQAAQAGADLSEALSVILQGYSGPIELVGHSHGTVVNAYAVGGLNAAGLNVQQVTMLDTPTGVTLETAAPGFGFSPAFYSERYEAAGVDHVINVYGTDYVSVAPATGVRIPGAQNFPVDANHSGVPAQYAALLAAGQVKNITDSLSPPPLFDPGIYTPSQPALFLTDPLVLNPEAFVQGPRSLVLGEQSPNAMVFDLTVPDWTDALGFTFNVHNSGDGDWWTLFFGEEMLWSWTGGTDGESLDVTIPFAFARGQTNNLSFILNSAGASNASAGIYDLRLTSAGLEQRSAVPDLSTWATMLFGFGAIGTALRRRRVIRCLA